MTDDSREVVTIKELSARWGFPPSTFWHWRRTGKGPKSFKLGGRVVYRVSEVESWLREQEQRATGGAA